MLTYSRVCTHGKIPLLVKSGSQPITPWMLLSHTSGLNDGLGFPGFKPSEARPDALAILTGRPPAKTPAIVARQAPMTKSRNSVGGSVVMRVLLMDAASKTFPELMQRPLGMG